MKRYLLIFMLVLTACSPIAANAGAARHEHARITAVGNGSGTQPSGSGPK